MSVRGPKSYSSLADFEREELHPHKKCGWSLDDIFNDATFKGPEEESPDDPQELDFDFGF